MFYQYPGSARGDLSENPSFERLLKQTRATVLGAFSHQELPFEKLVEELQPERDMRHTPLFQVLFNYHESEAGDREPAPSDSAITLFGDRLAHESKLVKFDLNLTVINRPGGLDAALDYRVGPVSSPTPSKANGPPFAQS